MDLEVDQWFSLCGTPHGCLVSSFRQKLLGPSPRSKAMRVLLLGGARSTPRLEALHPRQLRDSPVLAVLRAKHPVLTTAPPLLPGPADSKMSLQGWPCGALTLQSSWKCPEGL